MESKKCPYDKTCDKVIRGYNSEHIDYLMTQHGLAKHRNKVLKSNKNVK